MGRRVLLSLILITTVGLVSALALAHGGGGKYRSYGMGPGMMGMGPGMMGGMGHMGMMGGPGMMGMGPGMMGGMGPLHMLDLSEEQWAKVRSIQDNVRKQHWQIMGKIMDESSMLQELFAVDKPDPKKIGSVYGKIFDLRRQMIESGIEAHNQIEAVLTKEQHEQLEQMHRGRGYGMPGMMGPGMHHRGMMGG
ncbi:MAG: periplasmic heavy metal sensor [Burkholderiales bacterium]|nr:periplasmic heavy metal sensor [Burkholderiales bacterium]